MYMDTCVHMDGYIYPLKPHNQSTIPEHTTIHTHTNTHTHKAHSGPGGAAAETAALADKAHQLFAAPVDIMLPAGNTPQTRIKFWEAAAQVCGVCVFV